MQTALRFTVYPLLALAVVAGAFFAGPATTVASPGVSAAVGNNLQRPDGGYFFVLGANYVGGPDRSWTMWQDGLFDAALIDRDFQRAKAAGLNTLRLFVRPPLAQQLAAGQWNKLDAVVSLAEKYGLSLILTLYDYREDDLAKVVALDGAIAARYTGRAAILAYDLKNEPHYQDLAITTYPGSRPPLQTDALIKQYGERVRLEEAAAWRQDGEGKTLVPARFTAEEAYIYANNYRYYQEFIAAAGDWVTDRNYDVSSVDYMSAPESAKWRPLLDALDATLSAWLKPRVEAIRRADAEHLLTVGYSDVILASLKANEVLGFASVHRYPNVGARALNVALATLDDVRRAFPGKPVVFEEYGYSNAEVDPARGAIYETAVLLNLLGQGMAGGAKWSLYDLSQGFSARENNFGLYKADGTAKPLAGALRALAAYAPPGTRPPTGSLNLEAEPGAAGVRYVYQARDARFVAGQSYADPAGGLVFDAAGPTQVFASWPRGDRIDLLATAAATVRVDPGVLTGLRNARVVVVTKDDGGAVSFQRQGNGVSFSAAAGQAYQLQYTGTAVEARVEIVWPHDGKPVREAEAANIGAYLFEQGSATALCPQPAPTVRLWRALNNGVEEEVKVGEARGAKVEGVAFTAWDFNNIGIAATRDPRNKYYFRLSVDGTRYSSSVWSHAEDARTYLPHQDTPAGVAAGVPGGVDAKVEIVYPHDGLPVNQAVKANVGAYLFVRGGNLSVAPEYSPTVRLWRALNNGYEEEVAVGRKVIKREGGLVFPAWEFNDVDVSAARDPLNKYYFRVTVDGVDSRGNVWSHGADARTYFPNMDVPTAVGPCQ
ncbi:MAG: glycoside hydrolase 5 family protein [Chloroflexota bacterium]